MKIVFLGMNDWANECNRIARAITRANHPDEMQARCVIQHSHPFQYPEDIVLDRGTYDAESAVTVLKNADIIVTTGDGDYGGFDDLRNRLGGHGKPVVAMHAGKAYNDSPAAYDAEDRARGWRRSFMASHLYRFRKHDPDARVYFIPPDIIVDAPQRYTDKLRVYHTPSHRERKGSDEIERAFKTLRDEIAQLDAKTFFGFPAEVVWREQRRMHILVDHLEHIHGGVGGAACEGFAAGAVVMADWRNMCNELETWVEAPPGVDVRDQFDIEREIIALSKDPDLLHSSQVQSLSWARGNLSPEAIFRYWKEHLCSL